MRDAVSVFVFVFFVVVVVVVVLVVVLVLVCGVLTLTDLNPQHAACLFFLPSRRHFPGVVVVCFRTVMRFLLFAFFYCSFCFYSLCSNARIRSAVLQMPLNNIFACNLAIRFFIAFPPSHRPQSSVLHLSFYHGCSILLLAMEQSWFEADRRLD